jgi:hypothetical protein
MPENRPAIPAEIRRKVLVEAGHRCAIPTCRYIEVDVHHIIPWERCRAHEYDNLIALCPNCHRRADRDEIDRKALRIYKANLRFAHDKFSQFEMDIMFELNKLLPNQHILFPVYLALMIKRLLDAKYVLLQKDPNIHASSGGLQLNPDYLSITKKGIDFLTSLNLETEELT